MARRKVFRKIVFQNENTENVTKIETRNIISTDQVEVVEDPSYESPGEYQEDSYQGNQYREENRNREIRERVTSNSLSRIISAIMEGRNSSNMIGVFGMYSEELVASELRRIENAYFLGYVDTTASNDLYNNVAACILNYLNRSNITNTGRLDDYEARSLMMKLSEIYYDETEEDYFGYDSFERLRMISDKHDRNKKIINVIRLLKDYMSNRNRYYNYDRNNRKFIMVIQIDDRSFSYDILRKLSSLKSQDLVIITTTILPIELAKVTLKNSVGNTTNGAELMERFFNIGNIIEANERVS